MKRLLPHPMLSAALLAFWLLLNTPASLANWLLGGALALVAPWLARTLIPPGQMPRRLDVAAMLFVRICVDSIVSALRIAVLIARPASRQPSGHFVRMPLQLTNPYALTTLQIITCVIPGTVWCDYDEHSGMLVMHVLDLDDEPDFIAEFHRRYEEPLQRIFE